MNGEYRHSVLSRLKTLGKAAVDMAASPVVDSALNACIEKACDVIDGKLHELFRKTAVSSAVTLALNVAGMLTVIFLPFGKVVSRYAGAGFFMAAFVLFVVRTVLYLRDYGKTTLRIAAGIVSERSVSRGISRFVLEEFPLVSLVYTGIHLASRVIPSLQKVPRIEATVKLFIRMFWKKLALAGGVFALYTVTVFWIIKPLLLTSVAHLTWYEVYFFPFTYTAGLVRASF